MATQKSISGVILTKNEEENIRECLKSLQWCNEMIVIDDDSKDRTCEIAQKFGAKVFSHPLNNDFSAQRNFGLEKASGEWVLFVDADERVSEVLASEISGVVNNESIKYDGFYVKRLDTMWGQLLRRSEAGKVRPLRLAKKEKGRWIGKVHERWETEGPIGELNNHLDHYPHQTIAEFLSDINFYSTLRAQELYNQGVKISGWQILAYPVGKFLQNYFLKLGFLDGIPGFLVAAMMSFHSFLNRSKLWLLRQASTNV